LMACATTPCPHLVRLVPGDVRREPHDRADDVDVQFDLVG
jgi:hypothetical protein